MKRLLHARGGGEAMRVKWLAEVRAKKKEDDNV
jgi:hypothetical protein